MYLLDVKISSGLTIPLDRRRASSCTVWQGMRRLDSDRTNIYQWMFRPLKTDHLTPSIFLLFRKPEIKAFNFNKGYINLVINTLARMKKRGSLF